jgi:hypothetical protein
MQSLSSEWTGISSNCGSLPLDSHWLRTSRTVFAAISEISRSLRLCHYCHPHRVVGLFKSNESNQYHSPPLVRFTTFDSDVFELQFNCNLLYDRWVKFVLLIERNSPDPPLSAYRFSRPSCPNGQVIWSRQVLNRTNHPQAHCHGGPHSATSRTIPA